jgi:hypothetical protein
MAAPLNTCTAIEQRGVVRFFWAKGMAAEDIHKEMLPMYGEHCLSRQAVRWTLPVTSSSTVNIACHVKQYGEHCLSRQAVHNWVQKFSEGRTIIEDEHRVGWPTYSRAPPSCNWCSVFTVMRILIIARHNKTRQCCQLTLTVSRT